MLKNLLLGLLVVAAACDSDDAPAVAQQPDDSESPAAARPPAETPETVEPPATKVHEFRGVANLPPGHPCRDDATVLILETPPESSPKARSMKDLRASPDTDWVHIGPRTVRGARWTEGDVERMVVTCDLQGLGFERTTQAHRDFAVNAGRRGKHAAIASWTMGDCGECNSVEHALVQWLSRDVGDNPWNLDREHHRFSVDDEGNNQRYVARSHLMGVRDSDNNGNLEATVVLAGDCQAYSPETCPEGVESFTAAVLRGEAGAVTERRYDLDTRGVIIERRPPADRDNRTIAKARAILRELGKLD